MLLDVGLSGVMSNVAPMAECVLLFACGCSELASSLRELGFDRVVALVDTDTRIEHRFTALGSLYFLHRSLAHAHIWNFRGAHTHTLT